MRQFGSVRVVVGMVGLSVGVALGGCSSSQTSAVSSGSTDSGQAVSWPQAEPGKFIYPNAPRSAQLDVFHGERVADPYRWMEELDGDWTRRWIEAENDISFSHLEGLAGRDPIKDRLTKLWNYERYGVPYKEGDRYFYSYNSGLLDQNLVYVTEDLDSEPRTLLDPNNFSEDGTVALAGSSVSPDGRYIAYAKSDGGSDWRDWFFRDIDSGEDLDDHLTFIKFTSMSWTQDGSGVYYSRYPEGPEGTGDDSAQVSIYLHKIGTPQSEDTLVYDLTGAAEHRGLKPNPYGSVTEDGRYLVIQVSAGYHENLVRYIDLDDPEGTVVPVIDDWVAIYDFIGNDGSKFFFKTTDDAPNSRVIAIDIENDNRGRLEQVIPEVSEAMQSASYVGGRIVVRYLKDAKSQVLVHGTDGTLEREVELPGIGSAGGFGGKADDPETFFWFSGFTTPTSAYRYDLESGEISLFRSPEVDADLESLETKQVFYASKDGTRIPMFITHKKGLVLDGTNPTLLYGYGGFNVSLSPRYSTSRMVWMEMGGVLAIPNLRGGGEYGKAWHTAGTKLQKQNVFDDFIAAAEWLIDNGYTSTPRLAIQGGSNGGLLVGACMTQRPDLFGACLPAVGVLDMVRYHTASANARNWSTDYGLSENKDEFEAMIAYSPVHNVKQGTCYPPTLVTTADHDDRVVPWHSFKFAAALQRAQGCDNPILIRIETRAGHGAGKPTWMTIEEIADAWAFLVDTLDMDVSFD